MPRREVARLALETLASVAERRAKGDHLLVFVEGTRSRTATMQRVLPAAARYFEPPGTQIVPLGLSGHRDADAASRPRTWRLARSTRASAR